MTTRLWGTPLALAIIDRALDSAVTRRFWELVYAHGRVPFHDRARGALTPWAWFRFEDGVERPPESTVPERVFLRLPGMKTPWLTDNLTTVESARAREEATGRYYGVSYHRTADDAYDALLYAWLDAGMPEAL